MWYYTLARERLPPEQPDVVHAAVARFCICLGTPLFDPERHEALLSPAHGARRFQLAGMRALRSGALVRLDARLPPQQVCRWGLRFRRCRLRQPPHSP